MFPVFAVALPFALFSAMIDRFAGIAREAE